MICLLCGKEVADDDFPAMVDHMYTKHNAKNDEEAKIMANMNFISKPNPQ